MRIRATPRRRSPFTLPVVRSAGTVALMNALSRRRFLGASAAVAAGLASGRTRAQSPGERPAGAPGVRVELPGLRVPVAWIIDDSTCLVNVNRFAMPQFDEAFGGTLPVYQRNWRDWPHEIPDAFVRRFAEWSDAQGVRGKYSIVPYPACVGRLDRGLPGWSAAALRDSLRLVRETVMPGWDIHPEMVTHTRVIDLRTGHPHPEVSPRFMENWEWTTGRSADEIGAYMAHALGILRDVGLPCEGVTTPGGFGNRALPQLAQAAEEAVRSVFRVDLPHYFRHVFDRGDESVAPRVERAAGIDGPDPRCVVSLVGCTGDWTGGWDNVEPVGADAFVTADGRAGRVAEVIRRGEPALMLAHWTGIWWNGEERGFRVYQEVVRRLNAHFGTAIRWMKLGEVARYWAARELTRLERVPGGVDLTAPFAASGFTLRIDLPDPTSLWVRSDGSDRPLEEVGQAAALRPGTWWRDGASVVACFDLPRGRSRLAWS